MKNKEINSIEVIIPDTIKDKMVAISELSKAINSLAKSLESVNVTANISNCNIRTNGVGIGIKVK